MGCKQVEQFKDKKMKKKQFLIYPLLVMGLFLVFTSSCEKEENLTIVTTTEVTDITAISAISGGNITSDGGSAITARGVCWSTNPNPTIEDNKTTDGTGVGSFTSNITGLVGNTTYYVRAYATNKAGTSYGISKSFTAKDGVSFTDSRDGNTYNWVKIGDQVWMAENLKYLPSVVGPATGSTTVPYYYVHGYTGTNVSDAKNHKTYGVLGVLYNWPAAMAGSTSSTANPSGIQGVCPAGWHLPSDDEWAQLIDYLGGASEAGGKLKESGTTHWSSPNEGATNETGFTARPGGYRDINGLFDYAGSIGLWWNASDCDANRAWFWLMSYDFRNVDRNHYNKGHGFSVRCVKDN